MAISKDWYHTEMENNEMEILHRSPSVEYSFYNAVRSGDMETVTANCKNDSFLPFTIPSIASPAVFYI